MGDIALLRGRSVQGLSTRSRRPPSGAPRRERPRARVIHRRGQARPQPARPMVERMSTAETPALAAPAPAEGAPPGRRLRRAPARPDPRARPRRAADRRRRRPRSQRGGRPRAERPPAARATSRTLPVLGPDHHRRQREHRRHLAIARQLAAELPGVARRAPRRKGPRPGAARGVGGSDAAGPRLHGRRPLDRSRRAAAAGRPAVCGPQRRGDRHPAAHGRPASCAAPKREVISRGYNLILRTTLRARFTDAQCGFKAIRADARARLLPLVQDDGWFFDTELLVLAERAGCASTRCRSTGSTIPTAGSTSSPTAVEDLRGRPSAARSRPAGSAAPTCERVGRRRADRPGCRPAWPVSSCGSRPSASRARSPTSLLSAAARRRRRAGRQPARAAADRDRQYCGQPPAHLRRPRARRLGRDQLEGLASSASASR